LPTTMSKTIVIAGASRGIGRALVEQLAKDTSHRIMALSRDVERMKAAFASLPQVTCLPLDLSVYPVKAQLDALLSQVDSIDVLTKNAGYLVNKPFAELSHDDVQRSYQVNVIGVMETVQALLPRMQAGSHIVNISSMGGFQ